jgi:uncharacterized membrane protein YdjX (TVP38/TMEM64 family)
VADKVETVGHLSRSSQSQKPIAPDRATRSRNSSAVRAERKLFRSTRRRTIPLHDPTGNRCLDHRPGTILIRSAKIISMSEGPSAHEITPGGPDKDNGSRTRLVSLSALLILMPFAGAVVAGWTRDAWVESCAGIDGLVGFVAVTAPLCAASLLPTYAVAVGAGYVYGATFGPVVALAVVVLGAWLGLLVSPLLVTRHLLADCGARAQEVGVALASSSQRMTALAIGLIRLAPVTPFAWTNALMAGARVAVLPYLAGTLVGLAPRTALVAVAGASMAELEVGGGAAAVELRVTLGLLAVALVGLTLVARRLRQRIHP